MTEQWKYYIPDNAETVEDATPIRKLPGRKTAYFGVSDWAELASEQWWDDGGFECNIDDEQIAVIVAPDGTETRFRFIHEATVQHYARRVKQ